MIHPLPKDNPMRMKANNSRKKQIRDMRVVVKAIVVHKQPSFLLI